MNALTLRCLPTCLRRFLRVGEVAAIVCLSCSLGVGNLCASRYPSRISPGSQPLACCLIVPISCKFGIRTVAGCVHVSLPAHIRSLIVVATAIRRSFVAKVCTFTFSLVAVLAAQLSRIHPRPSGCVRSLVAVLRQIPSRFHAVSGSRFNALHLHVCKILRAATSTFVQVASVGCLPPRDVAFRTKPHTFNILHPSRTFLIRSHCSPSCRIASFCRALRSKVGLDSSHCSR